MSLVAKRGIFTKEEQIVNRTVGQATAVMANILNNSDLYPAFMLNSNATRTSEVEQMPCFMAEPNTALLTAIIMISTFSLAFLLKKLRESFYLGRHVNF